MRAKHLIAVALLLASPPAATHAQTLAADWSSFTGGGGAATAGVYTVTGTISQPATPRLNSSDFKIDGGRWSIIAAIQEPGAPRLSVRATQTNTVVVSWPLTWQGFQLQEKPDVTVTNWTNVATRPTIALTWEKQGHKQVVVPTPVGKRFYHLKKM